MDLKVIRKILPVFILLLFVAAPLFAAEQWIVGRPLSSQNPVNYPAAALANNDSIDRLLANFRQGMTLAYSTTTALSVSAGSVVCVDVSNVHYFRQNTSPTTINAANLDVGVAFANSTTYYVYANCSVDATTATYTISTSASTPTGVTAYRSIGSFATSSSGAIVPASVNQEANGYLTADASGNGKIQGIFDYGTSFSAYTLRTGNLKIAYGQATGIGGNSSQGISNLPFTSSSTYSCSCSQASATTYNESPSIVISSGSAATIYNNHNDSSGGNGSCNWICIGT